MRRRSRLRGKVVVLHFVPLAPWDPILRLDVDSLVDIYNAIHPKGRGLVFYEEESPTDLTTEIQTAYKELLAKKKNFEIVLVYVHDSIDTSQYATEESFWKTSSKMPWLALPFKDPRCKYLKRVFSYPLDLDGPGPDPRLVIIGPQGKYYELYGVDILHKFGTRAYLFTRMRIAKAEANYIKKLRLDMFWDPNTSFTQKNGPEVSSLTFLCLVMATLV
ncbi:hypothetical protein AgCh_028965 [Apium graveolens]